MQPDALVVSVVNLSIEQKTQVAVAAAEVVGAVSDRAVGVAELAGAAGLVLAALALDLDELVLDTLADLDLALALSLADMPAVTDLDLDLEALLLADALAVASRGHLAPDQKPETKQLQCIVRSPLSSSNRYKTKGRGCIKHPRGYQPT